MFSATMEKVKLIVLIGLSIAGSMGCNTFGAGKQMKQLEMENNRLLSEFRAERQRRESAERTTQQLEARLAESEKMLARQLQTGTGRLSSLTTPSNSPGTFGNSSDPSSLSSGFGSTSGAGTVNPGDLKWHRRN